MPRIPWDADPDGPEPIEVFEEQGSDLDDFSRALAGEPVSTYVDR